jgi:hypothetical protein
MCLIPPITDPFTCVQSMLSSRASSTRPIEQTLSPRTRYSPRGTSADGSGSSGVRIILSKAFFRTCIAKSSQHCFSFWRGRRNSFLGQLLRARRGRLHTRFVDASHAASSPTRIRESAVTIRTFSAAQQIVSQNQRRLPAGLDEGRRAHC